MESLHKYPDLEEHFCNSLTVLDVQNETEKEKQDLAIIIHKLTQEMQSFQKSEQDLILQLRTHSDTTENRANINSLYANLKEKHNTLQNKYNILEEEYSVLKEKCTIEKNEFNEDCLRQIKLSEEKICEQHNNFLSREIELFNKLEAQQASADIRYDDMESHLQKQIGEVTKKLHTSIQSCNTLREEFLTFKRQSNATIEVQNKQIQDLQKQLKLSQQQLQLTQEKLFDTTRNTNSVVYLNNESMSRATNRAKTDLSDTLRPTTNIIKNRTITYNENAQQSAVKSSYVSATTKYHPLAATGDDTQETIPYARFAEVLPKDVTPKPPFAGYSIHSRNKSSLPPLQQVSVPIPKPRISKKRKLYNPDNVDYMNNMEQLD